MVGSNELNQIRFTNEPEGYSIQEVDLVMSKVIETLEGYEAQSDDIYGKMDVLAKKVEEYRQKEDAIQKALVMAETMASDVKKEAEAEAEQLLTSSKEEAEKLVSDAKDYATSLIEEKTKEAEEIIIAAQTKANEAINSAKIVAGDILDQAKQISEDLISKSKAEKEAYEILIAAIKGDAKDFIERAIALYEDQLEALKTAKLDHKSEETQEADQKVDEIKEDVESLVEEIEEVSDSFPETVEPIEVVAEPEVVEPIIEEPAPEPIPEPEPQVDGFKEFDVIFDEDDDDEITLSSTPKEEELPDPMEAVRAFNEDTITPIDKDEPFVPIITEDDEEESLFDTQETQQNFESFFNTDVKDVHGDASQTISLVPPEDDEDEDEGFKGFFKKRK